MGGWWRHKEPYLLVVSSVVGVPDDRLVVFEGKVDDCLRLLVDDEVFSWLRQHCDA